METKEIANRLIELLRAGNFEEAQKELFHSDVESIEPEGADAPTVQGLEAVLGKGEHFRNSVESWLGIGLTDPIVSGNFIAVGLKLNLTFKGQDAPTVMDEIILYQVKDGKVVSEQFFY